MRTPRPPYNPELHRRQPARGRKRRGASGTRLVAALRQALRAATERAERAAAERTAALRQLEDAARESRHRVGNALQVVSGLLLLQGAEGDGRPAGGLERAAERIGVLAQVHRRLGHSLSGRIDFAACLGDLCDVLCSAAGRAGGVHIAASPVQLGVEQAVPLAQAVHELVGNALRHGGPPVSVMLSTEGSRIVLRVSDGGRGLPDGLTAAAGGGLGLDIVRALTRQLRGSFELARRPGGGTEARILAPPPVPLANPAPAPVAPSTAAPAVSPAAPRRLA